MSLQPGQQVRCNLAGMVVDGVGFSTAVSAALGTIIKQTSTDPPQYLVQLLFSFQGISKVEVTEDRIYPR